MGGIWDVWGWVNHGKTIQNHIILMVWAQQTWVNQTKPKQTTNKPWEMMGKPSIHNPYIALAPMLRMESYV